MSKFNLGQQQNYFCDKQLTKTLQLSFSLKDEEIKLIVVSPWERKAKTYQFYLYDGKEKTVYGTKQYYIEIEIFQRIE